MRLLLVVVLSASAAVAQDAPIRVALTDSSTVPIADVAPEMQKRCNVVITRDASKADYMLEAGTNKKEIDDDSYPRMKFTLFQHDDVVYSTSTRKVSNAAKDVCDYIRNPKHKR